MRDVFSEPSEPRRPISGTTAILCDGGVSEEVEVDVDVRTRSNEGRSGSGGPSVSSSLDADERVLRVRLLWRSRSRSPLSRFLVLSFSLLRSRSGCFLRRRCEVSEVSILLYDGPGVTESREAGRASAGEITSAAMGCFDWASEAGRLAGAPIRTAGRHASAGSVQGTVRGVRGLVRIRGRQYWAGCG